MQTFHPNCSIPTETPIFVTTPNVRSTLDIVWSCFAVLILSCWSVLHLHVPVQFRPRTRWQQWRLTCSRAWTKVLWMVLMLFAPELPLAKSVVDWYTARVLTPKFVRLAETDKVEWTKVHTHFADMGGFRISFDDIPLSKSDSEHVVDLTTRHEDAPSQQPNLYEIPHSSISPEEIQPCSRSSTPSPAPSAFSVPSAPSAFPPSSLGAPGIPGSGGVSCAAYESRQNNLRTWILSAQKRYGQIDRRPQTQHTNEILRIYHEEGWLNEQEAAKAAAMLGGDVWTLSATQLLHARTRGLIEPLPDISEEEISDKGESNIISKALSVTQVSWLVVQIVTRAVQHRSSSPLEVMTMSFAACAFIIYLLSLDRTQGAQTPIYGKACRFADVHDDVITMIEREPFCFNIFRTFTFTGPRLAINSPSCGTNYVRSNNIFLCSGVVASALFGGIHLFAYDFTYPTAVEALLWKTSSLGTMLGPLTIILLASVGGTYLGPFGDLHGDYGDTWRARVRRVQDRIQFPTVFFIALLSAFLLLARIFLLVEFFRSLYYLPPDAYNSTWTSNTPHIG